MTIYLVRHATAGLRNSTPDDHVRPLDGHGLAQADELKIRLGGRPIERVLSSPTLRCVQTVGPLAAALGVDIETDEHLREGSDPAGLLAIVSAARVSGHDLVVCSHGDLIPAAMATLRAEGVRTEGRKQGCAKGSFWELPVESGRIRRATYHRID